MIHHQPTRKPTHAGNGDAESLIVYIFPQQLGESNHSPKRIRLPRRGHRREISQATSTSLSDPSDGFMHSSEQGFA